MHILKKWIQKFYSVSIVIPRLKINVNGKFILEKEIIKNIHTKTSNYSKIDKQEAYQSNSSYTSVYDPVGFKNLLNKKFTPIRQHDSHEFLMHIISTLQDEEAPLGRKRFDGDVNDENRTRNLSQIKGEFLD